MLKKRSSISGWIHNTFYYEVTHAFGESWTRDFNLYPIIEDVKFELELITSGYNLILFLVQVPLRWSHERGGMGMMILFLHEVNTHKTWTHAWVLDT